VHLILAMILAPIVVITMWDVVSRRRVERKLRKELWESRDEIRRLKMQLLLPPERREAPCAMETRANDSALSRALYDHGLTVLAELILDTQRKGRKKR